MDGVSFCAKIELAMDKISFHAKMPVSWKHGVSFHAKIKLGIWVGGTPC